MPVGLISPTSAPIERPRAWPRSSRRQPGCFRADELLPCDCLQAGAYHPLGDLGTTVKKACIASLLLLCVALPAHAQSDTPAPFDGDLARLGEILGALHYLRAICGANEGQKWRNEMQALVDAEAPGGERRRKIVASFNRGYRGFQQTYRNCTPSADLAIRRYLDEGAKIARDITARYAN
jgi:uncharacterized protein (TIGR02301 family)